MKVMEPFGPDMKSIIKNYIIELAIDQLEKSGQDEARLVYLCIIQFFLKY